MNKDKTNQPTENRQKRTIKTRLTQIKSETYLNLAKHKRNTNQNISKNKHGQKTRQTQYKDNTYHTQQKDKTQPDQIHT